VSGIDYEIHLYRPRIEGLFSGIERWVNVNTGVSHWRTITTSNVTTLYGGRIVARWPRACWK
jgi:hypothetical protein